MHNPRIATQYSRLSRHMPVFLIAAVFLIYVCLPSRNWNYADDSLRWAYGLTMERGIISTHHLALNLLRDVYRLVCTVLGRVVDPGAFLATYAALCGALGLHSLYWLLRTLRCRRFASSGVLMCASTAGYWAYSIVGDVYVPATAFVLSGLLLFVRSLSSTGFRSALLGLVLAAGSFVLAILHHQAFFVIVVGLVPCAFVLKKISLRRRLCHGLLTPVAVGVLICTIYWITFRNTAAHEKTTFYRFVAGYADSFAAYPDMKTLRPANLIRAAAGITRAMVPANVLLGTEAIAQAVQAHVPYRHVYSYPYLVRGIPHAALIVLGCLAALSYATISLLVLRGAYRTLRRRDLPCALLVAVLPQVLFFVWWEPLSDEFWIWLVPIIVVMAAQGGRLMVRFGPVVFVAAALCLAPATFALGIYPYLDPENDIDFVNKRYIESALSKDLIVGFDEIVSANRTRLQQHVRGFSYFNVFAAAEKGRANDLDGLRRLVRATEERGGIIYIDPYLTQPPKSYMNLIHLNGGDFGWELARIMRILGEVDTKQIRWIALQATVPGFFAPSARPERRAKGEATEVVDPDS